MPAVTRPEKSKTDEYGIERVNKDDPGFVAKLRLEHEWFDHLMRMNERFGQSGGNQYAAGITYFSVLSMFPILMLVFAGAGFALANNPELLAEVQAKIADSAQGEMGKTINEVLVTAIDQRGAIAGIGTLTALWSGLGWMANLRYGVSKMWKVDPNAQNFLVGKLKDLVGLIGLLVALVVAFGVTAVGSSGLTMTLMERIGLDHIPGISTVAFVVALVVGLLANFLVFLWLIKYLPRTKVPMRSAIHAAMIGAVAFEVFKQLASVFFSNGLKNPAGATFGPIIGLMVLLYFVWRILLYCSAWAATTRESLAQAVVEVPEPAVIRVRNEVRAKPASPAVWGLSALAGTVVAALAFRKK
ncbi:inner membrane protein YhjD [Corynebacterium epidermidicanis]|uniref:Inner membrane protein n=1 Tax=Corynebacterium epidermidicanis TaxID=1050174 RepID=A0A0G3GPD4_9CORY|nr:inner membrane protein YhjD [Corynebacterium epidermidicanis]AKK02435.1 inner membrane protein [Corynebacterium epidermidicanis]